MGKESKNYAEIWFDEPYHLIGFNSKFAANRYAKSNGLKVYKTKDITEEEAMKYMIMSDAGYIFSMDSHYYGSAKRALHDALLTKYFVVTKIS